MKKSLLFAALLMVSVFVSLNSCKKEEEAPDVDCSTISGATYNAKVKPIIDTSV